MLRPLAVLFILLLQMCDVRAEQKQFEDRVGDAYEIRLESVTETSGTVSGSSSSKQTLVERVIALHEGGIELEFDLPARATEQYRARTWQFPARVLKSGGRPLQLLNGSELEVRISAWLKNARLTEADCDRWVFTWTAIKIECNPESVLQMLEPFDMRPDDLREGALYNEAGARGSAPLRAGSLDSGGATYAAEMDIDPDVVGRERASMDVAIAQMTGKQLAFEDALQAREAQRISGTIATAFEVNSAGRVTRRKRVTRIEIAGPAGTLERQTTTVTVERQLVSRSGQLP